MKIFFSSNKEAPKCFRVEGIGYNVKYIKNVVGTKVKDIIFIYIYIFQLRIVENHSWKDVGGCWKGPKSIGFETMRGTKKRHHEC